MYNHEQITWGRVTFTLTSATLGSVQDTYHFTVDDLWVDLRQFNIRGTEREAYESAEDAS